MRQTILVRLFCLLLLPVSLATAGEYAVLSTGFRIHADAHTISGDRISLTTANGVIEVPASMVAGFEQEEVSVPVQTSEPASITKPDVAPAAANVDPRQLVTEAAKKAGLPPAFVHSIVRAESAYQTNAVSPKGAIGLMQLMPSTAAALNANPYDVKQNVQAGVEYLRELLLKYQNDANQVVKAIAAYNAGPGAVDKYHGVPPYRETVDYVRRVAQQYLRSQSNQ
ncbi:MAG: transglycosylase SLT domain-containing protein [Acidobacteriaceae bacterium]|nr:transglycosylase SLT domain-containing protein [Acidobacteriaceae bacterium]